MKENLIKKHCTSRRKIDRIAKNLGLSANGSRADVLNRIKSCSYSQIVKATRS